MDYNNFSTLLNVQILNGEIIAYRKIGKGKTILILVHGNTQSSLAWDCKISINYKDN